MRFAVLALSLVACRSASYHTLPGGRFTTDRLNTPPELQGIELSLDLAHNRAELRDGATAVSLQLTRTTDRNAWAGGCGTMSSYAKLETASLVPQQFQLRGRTFSFEMIRADCFPESVWLIGNSDPSRLIFSR